VKPMREFSYVQQRSKRMNHGSVSVLLVTAVH
jgi:hypothetical protein